MTLQYRLVASFPYTEGDSRVRCMEQIFDARPNDDKPFDSSN